MKRVLVPSLQRAVWHCACCSAATRFVSHQPVRPAPPPPAEDDFVDVGFLADMHSSFENVEKLSTVTTSTEPVLGVVRAAVDPEGTEYSRFRLPLEEPRGGQPIPRENSRALLSPWEEEALMRAALDGMADEPVDVTDGATTRMKATAAATEKSTSAEARDDGAETSLMHARAMPLPDPTALPYDDEKFADMILEMEVEGAIDDAWQDTRKAHIEDVKEVHAILQSLKVRDICCIDVSAKTGNFDYMMFGTCEGARHIHLAAWAAQEADSLRRVSKIKRKQTDEQWEVVPIGRIVLNLMVESLRDQFTLERKWAVTSSMDPVAAANAPVSEGRQVRAHGLWTLTLNLQDLEDFEVDYCKDVLLRQ